MEIDVNTGTASTRFYGPLNGNQFTQYRWTFTDLNFVEPSNIEIVKITESARVGIKDGVGTTAFNQIEDQIEEEKVNEETYAKLYYKADLGNIKNTYNFSKT